MFIPRKAGVMKSKTVQAITANFISRGVCAILVKGAHTGIAASVIDALYFIAMVLNGVKQSAQAIKAFELHWHDKHYLITDEIRMELYGMFAKLSNIISPFLVRGTTVWWIECYNHRRLPLVSACGVRGVFSVRSV